jgi:glutamate carboxypeptidase
MGLEITSEPTGGSSDGNFTSAKGVPTLDGLGAVGHDYHTADEYVLVDSIAERAAVFAGLLHRLADGEK